MTKFALSLTVAAVLAVPGIAAAASTASTWDPANSTFVNQPAGANVDANKSAAAAAKSNYTQEYTYWDPRDSTFVTVKAGAHAEANHAAAVAAKSNYTQEYTYWDPRDSTFVTVKAGSSDAVVGTHEAPITRAEALNRFIERQKDHNN